MHVQGQITLKRNWVVQGFTEAAKIQCCWLKGCPWQWLWVDLGLRPQRAGFNSWVLNKSSAQALTVCTAVVLQNSLNNVLSFNFWHLDFNSPEPAYISWGSVPKNRNPQTTYLSCVLKRHLQTFVLFYLMSLGFICNLSDRRRWNMPCIPFPGQVHQRRNHC